MAYYGAQVIHPKPLSLENKNIPLFVSATDPALPTCIHRKTVKDLPPIIVIKEHQACSTYIRGLFVCGENAVSRLYHLAAEKILRSSYTNGAITLLVCTDDKEDKVANWRLQYRVFVAGGKATQR